MMETKPYWYPNTAYSMEPNFVCLHFPDLLDRGLHGYSHFIGIGLSLPIRFKKIQRDPPPGSLPYWTYASPIHSTIYK